MTTIEDFINLQYSTSDQFLSDVWYRNLIDTAKLSDLKQMKLQEYYDTDSGTTVDFKNVFVH